MSRIHSFLIYFREFFGATKNIWNGKKLQSSAFFRQWFFKLNWIFLWARLRRFSGAASDIYCCFLYTFLVCAIAKSMFSFWLRCARTDDARRKRKIDDATGEWLFLLSWSAYSAVEWGLLEKKRSKIHCRGCQKATDAINSKLGDAVVSAKKNTTRAEIELNSKFPCLFHLSSDAAAVFFLRSHENAIWNVRRRLKDDSRWIGRRCW